MFWLNAAETWIDIGTEEAKQVVNLLDALKADLRLPISGRARAALKAMHENKLRIMRYVWMVELV